MRPRRAAALALTAALMLGALAATRLEEGSDEGTIAADTTVARPTSIYSVSTTMTSSTSTTAGGETTTLVEAEADPSSVIQEALSAWGRFAVTGDLAEVEPWFVIDGPQYRQFEDEAAAAQRVGGDAYRVTFEQAESDPVDPNRVRGRVVFVRSGEASQSFDWWIVLRDADGRSLVWTVEEAGDQPTRWSRISTPYTSTTGFDPGSRRG